MPDVLPPVYVLYCEELPDARANAGFHLAERGIRPQWWRSIHAPTFGLETSRTYTTWPNGQPYRIAPKEVGCLLGHYTLWQSLWAAGVPEAILVEDDVVLPADFPDRFAAVRAELPPAWQFVLLGVLERPEVLNQKVTARFGDTLARLDTPFGTHCYLVRRSALPVLLARMAEARAPVDIQLYQNVFGPGRLDWYACVPSLAGQWSQPGDPDPRPPAPYRAVPGWFDFPDVYDEAAARAPAGGVLVEVGSWLGRSTAYLAAAARASGKRLNVVAVDHWAGTPGDPHQHGAYAGELAAGDPFEKFAANLRACGVAGLVAPVRSGSAAAAERFAPRSVDFVFVDADHSEAAVRADIAAWLPKVRPGGWIAGHDFEYGGVSRAVRAAFGDRVRLCGRTAWPCWAADVE